MFDTKYSINSLTVGAILGLIEAGTIAIPEIQRPFVWKRSKVRDLIDSMYNGYPTGYIIRWQSPNVKIKNGGESAGKFLLIDGQQRITALMTSILGIKGINIIVNIVVWIIVVYGTSRIMIVKIVQQEVMYL